MFSYVVELSSVHAQKSQAQLDGARSRCRGDAHQLWGIAVQGGAYIDDLFTVDIIVIGVNWRGVPTPIGRISL